MQKLLSGVILIGAFVVMGGAIWMVPSLQSADRAVGSEASRLMEKSRWLLHRYEHGLAYKSLMLDALAAGEVDVDVNDVDGLLDGATDTYQEAYETQWADYKPKTYDSISKASDVDFIARDKQANVGNLAGTIEEGVRNRNDLLDQNDALLDQALRAIDQALGFTSGGLTARDYPEANRLKGIIYYHKGLAARHEARHHREEATLVRNDLRLTGLRLDSLKQTNLKGAADSLSLQVESLEERKRELEQTLADTREELSKAESITRKLEDEAAEAEARAQVLLREMAELREEGVDFSDRDGAAIFEQKMRNLNDEYREVARKAAELMYGFLPNAEIDITGDYVQGRYLENGQGDDLSSKLGAIHHGGRKQILESTVKSIETAVASMESDIDTLRNTRDGAVERAGILDDVTDSLQGQARTLYAQMSELDSLGHEAENLAVEYFEESDSYFDAAARATDTWVRDGATKLREMTAEQRPTSGNSLRAEAGWLAGHIEAQRADAALGVAWCFALRYRAHQEAAALLKDFGSSLGLDDSAGAESDDAAAAKERLVSAVKDTVDYLERAHGKAGRHWTFVAQLAAINDLMALAGFDAYRADALETYRAAINSREEEGYSQRFARRIAELQEGS